MKVIFTDEADADLERIGDYIARDKPARAVTFVTELVGRCELVADSPRAFPVVPRHEHTGIRRCRHGDYLIFFRLDESADRVEILHVLHGAQDYERLLFPPE